MSNKSKNPLTAMTAGCIAGGVEATAVWPMEFIKTQLQLGGKNGQKLPYSGMVSGLSYTVRTTGFFSLYRGLAPTLLGSIPKAGIRFGLNSVIKDALRDPVTGGLTPAKNFIAGLGAGVTEALVIVAPVETVKTKCIELNMSFFDGLKYILKNEGVGGIYQGAFATALKQGSNQGLRFMWFNEYKRIVTQDGQVALTPIMGLFGGMSAGCFSTLGNNPFDVVKVRCLQYPYVWLSPTKKLPLRLRCIALCCVVVIMMRLIVDSSFVRHGSSILLAPIVAI